MSLCTPLSVPLIFFISLTATFSPPGPHAAAQEDKVVSILLFLSCSLCDVDNVDNVDHLNNENYKNNVNNDNNDNNVNNDNNENNVDNVDNENRCCRTFVRQVFFLAARYNFLLGSNTNDIRGRERAIGLAQSQRECVCVCVTPVPKMM